VSAASFIRATRERGVGVPPPVIGSTVTRADAVESARTGMPVPRRYLYLRGAVIAA